MYIFRDRGVFIDVYKADDKIVTSRAMSLADIDLRNNRTIDIVTTGRIPSLFCDVNQPHFINLFCRVALLFKGWTTRSI